MHSFLILFGTTQHYLFADFVLLYDLTVGRVFNPKKLAHPNIPFFGIVLVLALSAIFSPITLAQSWQTVLRIVALSYILLNYPVRFNRLAQLFLFVLIILGLWQTTILGERAHGHHLNPAIFGLLGSVLVFHYVPSIALAGSMIISLSIARLSLGLIWLYAVLDRTYRTTVIAILVTILFLIIGFIYAPERFTVSEFQRAISLRIAHLNGLDESILNKNYGDGRCGLRRDERFTLRGYGFGGYCHSTGKPSKHNAFLTSTYELGLLAIPFWIFVIFLAKKLPWRVLLPLVTICILLDDLYNTPEGIYIIAIWLLSTRAIPAQTLRTPKE